MARKLRRLLCGAALAVAALNLSRLAGTMYFSYAEQHLDQSGDPRILAAAQAAAQFAPWSSPHSALVGWLLTERNDSAGAESAYLRALEWAPADPLLWTEYAMALARLRQFARLAVPLERSQSLAPASPAVQSSNALLALSYWTDAPEAAQAVWLRNLRYELDHDRRPFLRGLAARGQAPLFCGRMAAAVGEGAWCQRVEERLEACRSRNPGASEDVLCILDE